MVWKTEIVLANHARGMCFDSDKVHKMLVRAADTPKVLWVSPPPRGVACADTSADTSGTSRVYGVFYPGEGNHLQFHGR